MAAPIRLALRVAVDEAVFAWREAGPLCAAQYEEVSSWKHGLAHRMGGWQMMGQLAPVSIVVLDGFS